MDKELSMEMENIVLRGLGLGGWMVQEGYMLQTGSFAGPQHVIKQKLRIIGAKKHRRILRCL
jgi:hypothetical protein